MSLRHLHTSIGITSSLLISLLSLSFPVRWFDWNEIWDLQSQVMFMILSSIVCQGSQTSSRVYDLAQMFLRFLILKRGVEGMEVLFCRGCCSAVVVLLLLLCFCCYAAVDLLLLLCFYGSAVVDLLLLLCFCCSATIDLLLLFSWQQSVFFLLLTCSHGSSVTSALFCWWSEACVPSFFFSPCLL